MTIREKKRKGRYMSRQAPSIKDWPLKFRRTFMCYQPKGDDEVAEIKYMDDGRGPVYVELPVWLIRRLVEENTK